MKVQTPSLRRAAAVAFAACLLPAALAQSDPLHGHLYVGAASKTQDAPLLFENGAVFVPSTGWSKPLPFTASGTYAGYYSGNITFTASATTAANSEGGAIDPLAAAPGSFLRAGILSVSGPAGGSFAFWDAGAKQPTFSYASGYAVAFPSETWALSDASLGAGTAGADPFGHIHGRRFTATVAGDYDVAFMALDASSNGSGGGPIHAPSASLTIRFSAPQAVPEPGAAALLAAGAVGLAWMARRRPTP